MNSERESRSRKHRWLVPAIAVAVLATGCGMGTPDVVVTPEPQATQAQSQAEEGSADSDPSATDTTSSDGDVALDGLQVQPQQAAEVALGEHPDAEVVELDIARANGTTIWQVDVASKAGMHSLHVDAVSGALMADEPMHGEQLDECLARLGKAELDYAAAIDAAKQQPGTLVELELAEMNGHPVWKAGVITGGHHKHGLEVDAVTGEVLKNTRHHGDEHHRGRDGHHASPGENRHMGPGKHHPGGQGSHKPHRRR